jgi:tRNA pseudouridine32 synthase/23S rRNA pseudouridine746 synthase
MDVPQADAATTLSSVIERLPAVGFELRHADDSLLVTVKPAGLPCVPARAAHLHDCLSDRVQAAFPDALVVHRLDMATSGLVIMARGKEAQRQLGIAFADRAVRKRYVAIVEGRPPGDADDALVIDLPLMADWPNRPKQKVDLAHGKPSLTRLRSVGYDDRSDTTRVLLEPVTGRTHQLRVHLQAIGHPIVGDALYGSGHLTTPGLTHDEASSASQPDTSPAIDARTRPSSTRLMLHASELWFTHPTTGEALHFLSEPPF